MSLVKFKKDSVDNKNTTVSQMTVFNSEQVDRKKQPMFFGKPLGIQRYDSYKYPVFDKLTTQQLDISGDQKKFHCKKIVQTTRHYAPNKSTFLPAILNTRSCWILYKGVVLGWLLSLTVHYLN